MASNSMKQVPSLPIIKDTIEKTQLSLDNSTSDIKKEIVQTWGQQCSPNCGCALRFNADIDTKNQNRIATVTYHAKTVITTASTSTDGKTILQPLLTQSGDAGGKGRPMLKECSCSTLHVLAKSITEELTRLTLSQAQNQLEFSGMRSSTAFRYSVLKKYNLLNKKGKIVNDNIHHEHEGKCFDLVEEALVACIKGYTLRPRPSNAYMNDSIQYPKSLPKENVEFDESSRNDINPLRFVQAAKKRAETLSHTHEEAPLYDYDDNFSKTSSMPPFHFMNGMHPTTNESEENESEETESSPKVQDDTNDTSALSVPDWVSYVDETHRMQQH